MSVNKNKLSKYVRDYAFIIFGLALYSFAISAFIVPEKVVTGGVVGLASLTHFAFGWNIAFVYYFINVVLLCIAFRTVGKQFVIRTIFGASVGAVFLYIYGQIFTEPIVAGQSFMNVLIGASMCGIGLGIVINHNGSSAGTDILAAMVSKHSNVSFGQVMLYCDVLIICSSYFIFYQIDNILFGLIFMVVNCFMADFVINNNRQAVQFIIISDKWEDIANAINNDAQRGCTLIHGTGWYTKQDVKMLMVVARRFESSTIFRIIKSIDPGAFISQTLVQGVFGTGFDEVKVRLNKYKPQLSDHSYTPDSMLRKAYADKNKGQDEPSES